MAVTANDTRRRGSEFTLSYGDNKGLTIDSALLAVVPVVASDPVTLGERH